MCVLLLFMPALAAPVATGLSNRMALILQDLCRAVAARGAGNRALAPLMVLLWSRLRRMAARFDALVAHVRAGRLPAASRARRAATRAAAVPPPQRLPRGFAWLVRLMPEAAGYGSQLQHLLADPDMPALLAAEPRLGRILRPLCRMLAIDCVPELCLPRRVVATCGGVALSSEPQRDPQPRVPRSADLPEATASDLAAAPGLPAACLARV